MSLTFQEKVRAVYKRQNRIAPLIEGLESEIPQQTLDDYYIKLNTIIKEDDEKKQGNYEAISGKKQEIEIEKIFDRLPNQEKSAKNEEVSKLLILGGAGVGKSTLMQYIAYRWSQGELWNQKFEYVYRVTLKTLLNQGWDYEYSNKDDILKCLVHYHLVTGLTTQERKDYKFEDMAWGGNKDQILLLLDGYDEVAHERKGNYRRVFEDIFEYKNIILTSRPNAIDKEMAGKFGRKIENIGLDYDGIGQYLSQYFKDDKENGAALSEFLEKNLSIKEICRIPVNIAMMCFIWAEGESNETLRKITNMSDLYQQVVDQLGFRYFTKLQPNIEQNLDELVSKWRGGEIYLDELQVLQHTAYKGMTGGGIEVREDQRVETLIIKGMAKRGDKEGISIQSSINYLRDKLKKEIPTINKVYKYGLLKAEGVILSKTDGPNKKEPSETQLQDQNFSFIHLSFQEFLTALYLAENLLKENNADEQEKIANFIAQHRNEPRYLMTLKLLSGILSAQEGKRGEQGLKIFWDAILCNPDGVLELGVEAKVVLLMHLFGQAKKEQRIDERIPNLEKAVNFVDCIVLRDISGWVTQLKDSDYQSENIQRALMEYFLKDNPDWLLEKSRELGRKLNMSLKVKDVKTRKEEIIEMIGLMINQFGRDEQNQVFQKVIEIMQSTDEASWQLSKKATEAMTTIHRKTTLDLELNQMENLLEFLLRKAYDHNLNQVSLKAMKQITQRNPTLLENVRKHVEEGLKNTEREAEPTKIWTLSEIISTTGIDDINLTKDMVEILTKLFERFCDYKLTPEESERNNGRFSSLTRIIKLAKMNSKSSLELVRIAISASISGFAHDLKCSNFVSESIIELVKMYSSRDPQLLRDTIKILFSKFSTNESGREVFSNLPKTILELVKRGSSDDSELVRDALKMIAEYFEDSHWYIKSKASFCLVEFVKVFYKSDDQLVKEGMKYFNHQLMDEKVSARETAVKNIKELVMLGNNQDSQLARDTFTFFISFSQKKKEECKGFLTRFVTDLNTFELATEVLKILSTMVEIIKINSSGDIQYSQDIITILKILFGNSPSMLADGSFIPVLSLSPPNYEHLVNRFFGIFRYLVEKQILDGSLRKIVKENSKKDPSLAKDIIDALAPFLKHTDQVIRALVLEEIDEIAQTDSQLAGQAFGIFVPLLADQESSVRESVSNKILEMIKEIWSSDTQLAREMVKSVTQFFTDPDPRKRVSAANIKETAEMSSQSDVEFIQDASSSLIPLLKNPSRSVRELVFKIILEIIEKSGSKNPQLARDTIKNMISFLEHSNQEAIVSTLNNIKEINEKSGQSDIEFIQDGSSSLIPLLKNPSSSVRGLVYKMILEVIEKRGSKNPQLARDIIKNMISFLEHSNQEVRVSALNNIKEINEISGQSDVEFIREVISSLIPFLQDPELAVRLSVSKTLEYLVCVSYKNDNQLCKYVFESVTSLLQEPDWPRRISAANFIGAVMVLTQSDENLTKDTIDILLPFLQDPQPEVRISGIMNITTLLKMIGENNIQLLKETIDIFTPFLQDPEPTLRIAALENLTEFAKMNVSEGIQLTESIIKAMTPLLQDSVQDVRIRVSQLLLDIVRRNDTNGMQVFMDITNTLVSLLQDENLSIRKSAGECIVKLIEKDSEMTKEVIEVLITLLQPTKTSSALTVFLEIIKISAIGDLQILKNIIKALSVFLKDYPSTIKMSKRNISLGENYEAVELVWQEIPRIVKENGGEERELVRDTIKILFPFLAEPKAAYKALETIKKLGRFKDSLDFQLIQDIINTLTPLLEDKSSRRRDFSDYIVELVQFSGDARLAENVRTHASLLLKHSDIQIQCDASEYLMKLLKTSGETDSKLMREIFNTMSALIQAPKKPKKRKMRSIYDDSDSSDEDETRRGWAVRSLETLALTNIETDVQIFKDVVNIFSTLSQSSDKDLAKNCSSALKSIFISLLGNSDSLTLYLNHPSKKLRDECQSILIKDFEDYFGKLKSLDELFQLPKSSLNQEKIEQVSFKLFFIDSESRSHFERDIIKLLEQDISTDDGLMVERELRLGIVSKMNKIRHLKEFQIIGLALAIIGKENTSEEGSENQKLKEFAKEALNIQLKYLTEEGLVWINSNHERLISLSPETSLFYKRVYHKLLEDEEISSLEEELIIKFINQGLTTSLTRNGEIIFEGKRYKLKGNDIEGVLEKIAKTIIEQQQDMLALQYKEHEPIFRKNYKGGMKEAAADKKEVKSIVDSRQILKNDSWLLTRLKSMKFNSEIVFLEQRSAFGDHVLHHRGNQAFFRFYPGGETDNEKAILKEAFGSYIYGEVYQGEVIELSDQEGQKLLALEEGKVKKLPKVQEGGKFCSKQIYFQQELLKEGNEDRNSAIEKELVKKLDNNRVVLESKLKSFALKDHERLFIEEYYEGFVSTFSSVYTSSVAIESGKLSIDDGEDFFSPVNLFIQLVSLAPFGIGDVLSNGLETARSHLKSTKIANEARFVKDIAIDAVDLSDLVSKVALQIISREEQRKRIYEEKDEEKPNSFINKVKIFITENLDKLQKKTEKYAEKYLKLKNLFEKEIETSPAFRLGESDANKIISEWIELKQSQPDLRMSFQEKYNKFVKIITGIDAVLAEENKTSPASTSKVNTAVVSPDPDDPNLSRKKKTTQAPACCEIF